MLKPLKVLEMLERLPHMQRPGLPRMMAPVTAAPRKYSKRGSEVQGQPLLHRELEAKLGFPIPCLHKNKQTN